MRVLASLNTEQILSLNVYSDPVSLLLRRHHISCHYVHLLHPVRGGTQGGYCLLLYSHLPMIRTHFSTGTHFYHKFWM